MAKAYNKQIKVKRRKCALSIGTKDPKYGKSLPNLEGPFIVSKVCGGGAYHLVDITGEEFTSGINKKYLKKFYPATWESIEDQAK